MSPKRPSRTTSSDSSHEWFVEKLARRVVWSHETMRCAQCDTEFALDTPQYYALLRASATDRLGTETRKIAYCTRSCGEEWLRSTPSSK